MKSIDWLNTAFSSIALSLSYVAFTRDRARIKVVVKYNWKVDYSEEKLVVIDVTNIGRRNVVYNLPCLIRPDGINVSPSNSVGDITLNEGEAKHHQLNQEEIEKWLEGYSLSDAQGLVIDTTGKRWYSRSDKFSQNIKFLWYRLKRKSKARSIANI